jgi:hypothetical protein
VAIIASVILVIGSTPAWATSYTVGDWTYRSSGPCVRGQTNINNNAGLYGVVGGLGSGSTRYDADIWGSCEVTGPWTGGSIRVLQDLLVLYWNGNSWQWGVCNFGPWVYNANGTSGVGTAWWYNHACGNAWYSDISYAEALLKINGQWVWAGGGYYNATGGNINAVWDQQE